MSDKKRGKKPGKSAFWEKKSKHKCESVQKRKSAKKRLG